jgi:LacI family transcriptional regulator
VGRIAAEKLIGAAVRDKRDPNSTIPYLVVRESSAAPPTV